MISIVTLTYNRLDRTKPFLASLYENTEDFELILVDNGSTDGTVEFLRKFAQENANVKLVLNTENKGYAGGNNQGIELAKGEYAGFLNNDILLEPGWTEEIKNVFDREEDAGLVSLTAIEPFQACARSFRKKSAKLKRKAKSDYEPVIKPDFACVVARKAALGCTGGFDENFNPAYYEDDDLSVRFVLAGYKNFVSRRGYFYHCTSSTGKKLNKINEINQRNRQYFLDKYRDNFLVQRWLDCESRRYMLQKRCIRLEKYKYLSPLYYIDKLLKPF